MRVTYLQVPISVLCKTLIAPDVDADVRERVAMALSRALQVQTVCVRFCLIPLSALILKSDHWRGGAVDEAAAAEGEELLAFLQELAEGSECADVTLSLRKALSPMLQLLSGLCLCLETPPSASVGKLLLSTVMLPLLDADDTSASEIAREVVTAGLDGRMLYVVVEAKDFHPLLLSSVRDLAQAEVQLLKWQRGELSDSEKDQIGLWISNSDFTQALLARVQRKAQLVSTCIRFHFVNHCQTAGGHSAPKDVVRVRAASFLISLADLVPALKNRAESESLIYCVFVYICLFMFVHSCLYIFLCICLSQTGSE